MQNEELLDQANAVLQMNERGNYTQPAEKIYPHQWLWDSCFIAIGLRHLDVERAQTELRSLLRGQWHNGMLPNIIFRDDAKYNLDRNIWRSWLNPYAPENIATTGITQPPMLAEAVTRVGAKMAWPERRLWYQSVYPALLEYHRWLYAERDPHNEGLVLQIHPWETGLDSTPPWIHELREHQMPAWIRLIKKTKTDRFIGLFRRDKMSAVTDQRLNNLDALALYNVQRRLRRKHYEINRVLSGTIFSIEDLNFNCILIRANTLLRDIAKSIKQDIPEDLSGSMEKTEQALEYLWDPYSSQYYSREFTSHKLLKIPTVAALMPLYAGNISVERAQKLVKSLENEQSFGPAYPLPSVPLSSFWFNSKNYWQGPAWVNINWLIIDGLKRYGFKDHAAALAESTLEMVAKSGCREYFDPLDGSGAGASNFSWTAALAIDLIKS